MKPDMHIEWLKGWPKKKVFLQESNPPFRAGSIRSYKAPVLPSIFFENVSGSSGYRQLGCRYEFSRYDPRVSPVETPLFFWENKRNDPFHPYPVSREQNHTFLETPRCPSPKSSSFWDSHCLPWGREALLHIWSRSHRVRFHGHQSDRNDRIAVFQPNEDSVR